MNGSLRVNIINTKNSEGKSKFSVTLKSTQLYEKKTPTQVFPVNVAKFSNVFRVRVLKKIRGMKWVNNLKNELHDQSHTKINYSPAAI